MTENTITCENCGDTMDRSRLDEDAIKHRCECHSCTSTKLAKTITRWIVFGILMIVTSACYGCWMDYKQDMETNEQIQKLIKENPEILRTHRISNKRTDEIIIYPIEIYPEPENRK